MSRATRFSTVCLLLVLIAYLLSAVTYSAAADNTTTTMCSSATNLGPSPASPTNLGVAVTFTAFVDDTSANNQPSAGSVQFTYTNGGVTQNLGGTVTLTPNKNCANNPSNSGSIAQITTSTTPAGAAFLPGGDNVIKASYSVGTSGTTWNSSSDSTGIPYHLGGEHHHRLCIRG
jgi:hypothetical protein